MRVALVALKLVTSIVFVGQAKGVAYFVGDIIGIGVKPHEVVQGILSRILEPESDAAADSDIVSWGVVVTYPCSPLGTDTISQEDDKINKTISVLVVFAIVYVVIKKRENIMFKSLAVII